MPSSPIKTLPFSLKEIFSANRGRGNELRAKAREVFGGDFEQTKDFMLKPNTWLDGGIPLDMSVKSADSHKLVMDYLTRVEHCVYT